MRTIPIHAPSTPWPITSANRHRPQRRRFSTAVVNAEQQADTFQTADVILVDAQNVLSRAHADHRRACRLPGDTPSASFAAWLHFLSAVAEPQLVVAVFDAPSRKQGQQRAQSQRQQLAPEYLERRRRRQAQQLRGSGSLAAAQPASAQGSEPESPAPSSGGGGDPLTPYKQLVSQLGGIHLEAAGGWEADDGLAAACAALLQQHPAAKVLVASGDGDMQQLLGPQVSWLQLQNQASPSCPLGVQGVTALDFECQFGFPASAYPDWLALVGKREASMGSAGVGAKTAAKLLARFGSLEAVLAAADKGELKGWGPQVAKLLARAGGASSSGGSSGEVGAGGWEARREQLLRNRRLFAANTDPAVVDERGWAQLQTALGRLQPAEGAAAARGGVGRPAAELAWLHPLHARRRRHLQQCMAAGAPALATTAQGHPVDELHPSAQGGTNSDRGGKPCAVFHVCPCDVAAGSWPTALAAVEGQPAGSDCTAALLPLLHGAMRHHVGTVRQAGHDVRLSLASGAPL